MNEPSSTTQATTPPTEMLGSAKPRMEWIDAMRGFTMLLVVAYHVSNHGFDENPRVSTYLYSFVLFRMPLFFFISGFFSYSAKIMWSAKTLGALTWKKFRIQMLPTIIFFSFYVIVSKPHFWEGAWSYICNDMKGGFWFTYVLLLMFVIYYLYAYAESKILRWWKGRGWAHSWIPIASFWFIWLCIYATWYMPSWFTYPKHIFFQWTSFGQVIMYFHFFLAGNIVHRYWDNFQRLFDAKWFVPIVLTVAIICLSEFIKWHTLHRQWINLPRTLAMYSLMTIVVLYFRHYADAFSKNTAIGRALQYIGVRTLDIYLIHVLFIPKLPFVGVWLKSVHNPFAIDILLSLAGGILVTSLCIIVSNIFRMSPLLKYYLFGRK